MNFYMFYPGIFDIDLFPLALEMSYVGRLKAEQNKQQAF